MTQPPPLVLIEWEDARVLDDGGPWTANTPTEYRPHLVQQVGFLVLDAPEGVHLTHAWHPDLVAPREQIPRSMIRRIEPLVAGVAEPRKKGPRRG